jgi:Zn-dependent peptidase ImmA (M78 family)
MPLEEIQGFCYSDFLPNCIVVNSKHPYTARTFTLFHELGHLLNSESGACTPENVHENQKTEFRCNKFAGQFLIPENTIVETDNLDEIRKYSSQLKISREVYLRRLYESEMIDDKKFFSLLKTIKASYKDLKGKKTGGAVRPTVRSKAERGETFYNLVIRNLNDNKISYSNASDILGLNLRTLLGEV